MGRPVDLSRGYERRADLGFALFGHVLRTDAIKQVWRVFALLYRAEDCSKREILDGHVRPNVIK